MTDPLHFRNLELKPWQKPLYWHLLSGGKGAAWAGGRGSGKSVLTCAAACGVALSRPGAQVTVAMDTYTRLADVHLPILTRMLKGEADWQESKKLFTVRGIGAGSVIRLRHLDMPGDPALGGGPLEGPTLDLLVIDEAQEVARGYWTQALARVRSDVSIAMGLECGVAWSGLPGDPWWVRQAQEMRWPTARPRTRDNNSLPASYEADMRASLTERQAASLLDGEDLVAEGACYREYIAASEEAGGHWTEWEPDWSKCRTCLVIDPGYNFPHAILFAQDHEHSRWVAMREWAPDDASTGDMCRLILREAAPRRVCGMRLPIDEAVVDPAAKGHTASGATTVELFAASPPEGLGLRPRFNEDPARVGVADGIDKVNVALYRRSLMFSRALMERGLSANPKARTLARCMVGYRRGPSGTPLKGPACGECDHGADVVRYFVREHLWGAGVVVPSAAFDPMPAGRPTSATR